jgi:hypothetical protein
LVSKNFPPDENNLLADFADYAPFMLWFGEKDFIKCQIQKSKSHLYESLIKENDRIISWRLDEYLEGLISYYRTTQCNETRSMIEAVVKGVRKFLVCDGYLLSFYNIRFKKAPRIIDPRSSALIEVLLDFEHNSEEVLEWLDSLIQLDDFKRYGLIPCKYYFKSTFANTLSKINPIGYPRRFLLPFIGGWRLAFSDLFYILPMRWTLETTKFNTNFAHCLVTAYMVTRNDKYRTALYKWVKGLQNRMIDGCVMRFSYANGKLKDNLLSHNFPAIDVLCDVYMQVDANPILLKIAKDIANFWLNARLQTRLFPKSSMANFSHLDDQTDMYVSLHRLYECTQESIYLEKAEELLPRIIRYYKTENGLVLCIDWKGQIYDSTISPKFNALFLKAIIHNISKEKIYENWEFYNLMKDR